MFNLKNRKAYIIKAEEEEEEVILPWSARTLKDIKLK